MANDQGAIVDKNDLIGKMHDICATVVFNLCDGA